MEHWLLIDEAWKTHRETLFVLMQEHQEDDRGNLAAFLCLACKNYKALPMISLTCGMQDLTETVLLIKTWSDLTHLFAFFAADVYFHMLVLHWTNLGPKCLRAGCHH